MNDEYDGQGGMYVLDMVTGKRRLVFRTMEPCASAEPEKAAPVVVPGEYEAQPHDGNEPA